ncbi:hypothetical protein TNCV_895501 [Trichonephila clavipes]|nr:hypothetical protein TNCV_895501 [Trichonephila clavipes]
MRGERRFQAYCTLASEGKHYLKLPLLQLNDGASHTHGNGVFQHDNSTSHKSRLATDWLYEHFSDFSVINWRRRSLDLNAIEASL